MRHRARAGLPYTALSGFAFAQAKKSFSVFTLSGTAGPTESTWCVYMASDTGVTSSSAYWSLR